MTTDSEIAKAQLADPLAAFFRSLRTENASPGPVLMGKSPQEAADHFAAIADVILERGGYDANSTELLRRVAVELRAGNGNEGLAAFLGYM